MIPTALHPLGRRETAPAIPYVTDGLVAWWDGIWNAGLGVHDAAATVWRDLVGSRDLTLNASGVSWSDNALVSAISTRNAAEYTGGVPTTDFYTVELVKGATTGRSVLVLGGTAARTDTGLFMHNNEKTFRIASGANNSARRELAGGNLASIRHLSVRYSTPGATAASVLADGVALTLSHDGAWGGSNSMRGVCVFGFSDNSSHTGATSYPVRGNCNCIRLYNRALTDAEVAANYAVDKTRFDLP